ncbi:hypothetical protein YC2023_098274 [Brassica napus]
MQVIDETYKAYYDTNKLLSRVIHTLALSREIHTITQPQLLQPIKKGEIAGDIVGFQGEIAGEKRGVAQRKKREMGKKKGLVVIKPRVGRTLSVGILISIFAKYLPGKMKIFRGNTEELVKEVISSVPRNFLDIS